jgi:nucleoside-diphosphate-sugar epimerase
MHIAILGANSQIARDTIAYLVADGHHSVSLFARRPDVLRAELPTGAAAVLRHLAGYEAFGISESYDAIVNFVGVGNPVRTAELDASVVEISARYDDLALDYLRLRPDCRYVFLSSGVAYGGSFEAPASEDTFATVPLNALGTGHWYALSKLIAECRHRALASLPITDLRVFNYFSHRQDLSLRFLATDMVRALLNDQPLVTSRVDIVRDYLGGDDFNALLFCVLQAPAANAAYDCYSRAPIAKSRLLATMAETFGLQLRHDDSMGAHITGLKPHYYSLNRRAASIGYAPVKDSLETVIDETRLILAANSR